MAGIAHRIKEDKWLQSQQSPHSNVAESNDEHYNNSKRSEQHESRRNFSDLKNIMSPQETSYAPPRSQVHHSQPHDVASQLLSNSYSAVRSTHPTQNVSATSVPRSPPSPPAENTHYNNQNNAKPSLPPIASLLGYADTQRGLSPQRMSNCCGPIILAPFLLPLSLFLLCDQ